MEFQQPDVIWNFHPSYIHTGIKFPKIVFVQANSEIKQKFTYFKLETLKGKLSDHNFNNNMVENQLSSTSP